MSLLLKALKRAGDKAAGERAGGRDPSASLADSLSLEPIEPASRNTASDTRHAGWGARSTPASPRASRLAPWLSGERSLVPAVAVLAAVVMLGYAAYVYWQTRPQPVLTPPPATQAGLPSAHVSAPAAAQLATLPEIKPAAPPAAAPRWGSGVSGKPAASGRATPPAPQQREPRNRTQPLLTTLPPQLDAAWQAFQQGRIGEARSLYQQVPGGDRNADVQLGLAAIALADNNAAAAAHHYQRVLELDPRNPAAHAGLISLMGDADPAGSEGRLKALIASQPSAQLQFTLGNVYAQQKRWPQAQQAYFEAYQMEPASADYAYNLAVSLEHINQSKAALNYYRRARDLMQPGRFHFDPARLDARINQLSSQPE